MYKVKFYLIGNADSWLIKLGWLTAQAYADALTEQIGRSAALVEGYADRPLAKPTAPVQII